MPVFREAPAFRRGDHVTLPPGLTHLARSDDDDPVVEEVWL
jgi:hypothetical protein